MSKSKFRVLGILLVMIMIVAGCQETQSEEEEGVLGKDTIRVGMELLYPPFETRDENGDPAGASVMLAKALGDYLDKEIEIVDTPYDALIPALQTGDVDLVISSMTITDDRKKEVDFSIPYTTSQLMMLAYIDSPVNSPDDLNNEDVIISAKTGTVSALWAAKNAPKAKVVTIDSEDAAVLEVAQGNADVFIYDPLSIVRHHENHPDTTKTILEPLPNVQGWGMAFQKGQPELKEKLDAFIKQAREDGTYDEIREAYLQDNIAEFEEYGLDFFF